jgi:hypothetical protein
MLAAAIAVAAVPAAAEGDGTVGSADSQAWARWQGRLSLGPTTAPWRVGSDSTVTKLSSAALMGDYYFYAKPAVAGHLGGFRATSGLIFGSRGSSLSIAGQPNPPSGSGLSLNSRLYGLSPAAYGGDPGTEPTTTLPYLGFGYTELSARSGWSFSADLGLIAQGSGSAARLGRTLGGGQSLDEAIRDMRLAPLVQVGVSYAF